MSTRVLLVDDAPEVRRLISVIISVSDSDWQVVGEAENGAGAIAAARDTRPDLVLLDIAMPVMDGIEALPEIRAAVPKACIVMLTGFADRTLADTARQAGANGYLEKDDLVTNLVPAVERILAAATVRT
jgi:DNA-binding NarL/FixJ family response regulator